MIKSNSNKQILYIENYGKNVIYKKVFEEYKMLDVKLNYPKNDTKSIETILSNYVKVLQKVPKIQQLQLNIVLDQNTTDDLMQMYLKFLMNDIIQRYQDSIESLCIYDSNLMLLVNQEKNKDEIENFLIQLLSPLKNLTHLQIEDRLSSKNFEKHSILPKLHDIMKQKQDIFTKLTSISIDSSFTFNHHSTKNKSIQLFVQLISISGTLKAQKSLISIEFCLQNLNLDSNFIKNFSSILSTYNQVKRFVLDISENEFIKAEDTIYIIKNLTHIARNLEQLTLIDNSLFTIKNSEQFSEYMKEFSHLNSIRLETFNLKQGSAFSFLQFLNKMQNLNTIGLDMQEFIMKGDQFIQVSNFFKNNFRQIKILDLTLPTSLMIKEQEINSICLAFEEMYQTLQDFRIVLLKITDEAIIIFAQQLSYFVNLKSLVILFLNNKRNFNLKFFCNDGQQNIFELSKIKFKYHFYDEYYFKYLLLTSEIIRLQKKQIEKFYYYHIDISSQQQQLSQLLNDQIIKNMKSIYKQTSIRKLACVGFDNDFDIGRVIQNNQKSLQYISLYNCQQSDFNQIFYCENLVSLCLQSDLNRQNVIFEKFEGNQRFLSTLVILGFYFNSEKLIDNIITHFMLNSDYLTGVQAYIPSMKQGKFQMIKDRKQMIYQLICYEKYIKDFIIFKQNSSHWDLLL